MAHFAAAFFRLFVRFFSCDCAVEPEVRDLRTPNWNKPELSIPAADQKDRSSGNENELSQILTSVTYSLLRYRALCQTK